MSKAVLISIKPKWCKLIASGRKTVEVRKTRPKLNTPFKCYIYQTKNGKVGTGLFTADGEIMGRSVNNGKVIGEFVCNMIANYEAELWDGETFERIQEFYEPDDFWEYGEYEYQTVADSEDDFWEENMLCKASCVSIEELRGYLGAGMSVFYGWHISDLVIYDRPKKLRDFIKPCIYGEDSDASCFLCDKSGYQPDMHIDCFNIVTRPPQSWCYVEEMEGGE